MERAGGTDSQFPGWIRTRTGSRKGQTAARSSAEVQWRGLPELPGAPPGGRGGRGAGASTASAGQPVLERAAVWFWFVSRTTTVFSNSESPATAPTHLLRAEKPKISQV